MKKILLGMALAIMLVWGVGVQSANAGYVDPLVIGNMDPVTFYVVDDDSSSNDDSVTLSFTLDNAMGGVLQYSTDNTAWTDVLDTQVGPIAASNWQQIWLRLEFDNGTDPVEYDTDGEVTFYGLEDNSGLYNSVQVIWDTLDVGAITLKVDIYNVTAQDDDNVAPVPIPAAIWLFGSGLLGMVGIRRRSKRT